MRGFLVLWTIATVTAAPQGFNNKNSVPYNQYNTGSFITKNQKTAISQYPNAHTFPGSPSSNSQYNALHQTPSVSHGYNTAHREKTASFPTNHLLNGFHHDEYHESPIISKHFYIHSAPEEKEDYDARKTITLGKPRIHYRVVFIKAPVESSRSTSLAFTQAQNEEKTVIYVLSKKTDSSDIQTDIQVLPTVSSKPEVFFIKYKTPEEATHAQEQIQAQYDSLGGTSHITDEGYAPVTSVIGALGHNSKQNDSLSTAQNTSNTGYLPPLNNGYLPPSN